MEPVPFDFLECEQVFERHVHEHPLVCQYQRASDGRASKITGFLTQRQFHRLELYNEFFRRLEVERQMAVTLPAPASLVIEIAVNRSSRDRDFSE